MVRTLLQWLGFPERESTSRDLLAWLVDSVGEEALTPLIGFEAGPVVPGSLRTEHALLGAPGPANKMRLDLYVESAHAVIGVEMKIHSSAGAGQLDAYAAWLRGRPGARRSALVFLTETGVVPEYPDEFRERIRPVELVCATWDSLNEVIPDNDPLGWKVAANERALEIRRRQDLVCGSAPLQASQKMDARLANVHGRGILALATRVASATGLRHVHGPKFGAYGLDPTVDLDKPAWTVDLGFDDDLLRKSNPLHDARLRFAVRARFCENERGELTLGIGSTFIPYPPDVASKSKREAMWTRALVARGRAMSLRQALIDALPSGDRMSDSDWYLSHTLVERWTGDRVARATEALDRCIPVVDRVVAQWRAGQGASA